MLYSKDKLEAVKQVAESLGELKDSVVFVGGAVIGLYVDDPAAEDIRPTKDVDITAEITSIGKLEDLRQELSNRGFKQSHEDQVICRFRLDNLLVDVMSTHPIDWVPANRWFKPGFDHLEIKKIDTTNINILSLPFYLAAKFESHQDRGGHDPRMSKDFEDITFLLDNITDFKKQVYNAPQDVRKYLFNWFEYISDDDELQEAIIANLPPANRQERFEMIIDSVNQLRIS